MGKREGRAMESRERRGGMTSWRKERKAGWGEGAVTLGKGAKGWKEGEMRGMKRWRTFTGSSMYEGGGRRGLRG